MHRLELHDFGSRSTGLVCAVCGFVKHLRNLRSLMPVLIPRALQGLYFLCEPIADGSFGRLYLAIHALTRQHVAVKIIDKKKLGVIHYFPAN